ncbi:MAG TPA: UDP-N-acetylmuramoyl-tripeptide--D-alanyl-D-alanine ligase [bacterium]|jgi:UDP-N-acetylmuramyl pentapeptide synthase|nr:UDP-N-acetylmuramoyl-tripeptide--D-alanyl-D-alanine ligase [bacterium]HOQ91874.1 UDP-N-acetylmuramoyl-tripeptide--D-alanyl-D-alanine ligase [bacterium]HPL22307.1 UDP-N-acetylmuramoyl-tripeptide--D-alanyl-D-alanine ligase [bacterium]HPX64141.1 UDP-N-acetylmuramoyl-tripeptide--D-alanyl-D-alanine ligase [bacterium]
MLSQLLRYLLKRLARAVIDKYQPQIIGITGSVGKTTTKEAVLLVLAKKYRVRGNIKNYNNEIGLPLTILGLESPGRSIGGWLKVLFLAWRLIQKTDPNYPEFLVLEMGIDHPGDMDYLLSIVQPNIGIITVIGQAHLEFFGNQDKIAQEKGKLIVSLPSAGWAVLNADDQRVRLMTSCNNRVQIITYGFGSQADVRATDLQFNYGQAGDKTIQSSAGLRFKLNYQAAAVAVVLPGIISEAVVYSVLAAIAVGISQDIDLLTAIQALGDFHSPKGRLNILAGYQDMILLDDSYNASPTAVAAALDILGRWPALSAQQRVAVLGDMLELGVDGPAEHRRIGQIIAQLPIGRLVLVGPLAEMIGQEARQRGWTGQIDYFTDSIAAADKIREIVPAGAIVLLKGSQGSRIERITKALLLDPAAAANQLVRQDSRWLDS